MNRPFPSLLRPQYFILALGLSSSACEPSAASSPPEPSSESSAESPTSSDGATAETQTETHTEAKKLDTSLGGQLFDKWYAVRGVGDFTPDAKKTEAIDGAGGPRGDGTLNDGSGHALSNAGHDYRIKNLFGWDLRGAEGIYGPAYQNKTHVLDVNLLTDTRTQDELVLWFTQGDEKLPAFGEVMKPDQVEALAAFVVAVREGELPRPDQVFALSAEAPKNYTLNTGADTAAGTKLYAQKCSGCHGTKGDEMMIDGDFTLGAFGRMKAYEGWLKVVNGHPGSPMSRQSDDAQEVLNIFAALCDRETYPAKDAEHEVQDGDLRCGAYLK